LYLLSEWGTYIAPGEYLPGTTPPDSMLLHTRYYYDDNRYLVKVEETRTYDDSTRFGLSTLYQRDACGNVLSEEAPGSPTNLLYKTFSYNEAGVCTLIHAVYDSYAYDDSIMYKENEILIARFRNGAFQDLSSHFFLDPLTQNITQAVFRVAPTLAFAIRYSYDDKINPRKKLRLPPGDNLAWDFSFNNVIATSNDTLPFTYNAQGYPVTAGVKTLYYVEL
jgi:hypothetical protein